MPIPTTRRELNDSIEDSFAKLEADLDRVGDPEAEWLCTEEWTIRDLVAVRVWWARRVADWIASGKRGRTPHLPAEGYGWNDTPRLNDDTVAAAKGDSLATLRRRLRTAVRRIETAVEDLGDADLLRTRRFAWAGKWPLSRWISINTATQFVSARKLIRRALKNGSS